MWKVMFKEIKTEFRVLSPFPGLQNLYVFLESFCGTILEIICSQKQFLRAPYFLFSNSLPYGLEESRVERLEFLSNRHAKVQKSFCWEFFVFLRCHYGFTNCFEKLDFVFPNIIPRGISASWCATPSFCCWSLLPNFLKKGRLTGPQFLERGC